MGHTYSDILLHVVFSTKERRPFLDAEIKPRLLPYFSGITKELGARLLVANGPADHVHLLLSMPPVLAPARFVRVVKGGSSRWVHDEWPERAAFSWQDGYGAFSVSHRSLPDIERYIADQEEHHRQTTFQEEFRKLLTQHGILFDERYIWG